ncbi:MAG TPA: b(o/a)3-type cytochrome-c oxidase subunit 1 [Roseiflexaceae bacterium]|nr:b(o/a)3-type cytochrome-c oxidase subunit 1 [Roseiflexaceae bacterium]
MATAHVSAGVAARQAEAETFATENRLAGLNLLIAFLALAIGGLMGVFQALEYNKVNLYPAMTPVVRSYYHGLALHGVLNVLVFTTFYIIGWLTFVAARSFGRPLASKRLAWATFGVMTAGVVLAAIPLLANNATVMFTFYPPLKADFLFYLGLTLVVVGTWLLEANLVLTYRRWRADNPGVRTPLPAFMSMVTMTMWTICTVGVAAEMLFMLIPWSLGLVQGTDPILARTLFWLTGHPIVYFWLLPAYISWYNYVPQQAGGKLFSDPMARVAFILFLILSTPIGLHHQFTDPGISEIWKLVHAIFTFAVFFPSLLTFFNVIASLESGGRARGGQGWLGWIFKLPWKEPSFTAQVLAMILFAFGGAGGLINASYNVNLVVHNTAWISGHFHLTVGTAVTLSFMGITYWLVPLLTKRALWSRRVALAQAWTWFIGMALFSHAMHTLGLLGMPRRTQIGETPYLKPEWEALLPFVMVGALIMFVSAILYYLNMVMTITAGKPQEEHAIPLAKAQSGPEDAPPILDRWTPWVAIAIALVLINYAPLLFQLVTTSPFNIPGMRSW